MIARNSASRSSAGPFGAFAKSSRSSAPDSGRDIRFLGETDQAKFHEQFAQDIPQHRPGRGVQLALWKTVPSWHVYGAGDRNITAAAMKFMAEQARSQETIVVKDASRVVMVSNPETGAKVVEDAAAAEY